MAKVTEKNTKKEILEALRIAEEKLAERRSVNTTTADIVRVKEVETMKQSAKEIVNMNILNNEIVEKYNGLMQTVDMLEREIQELHEVKAGLDTLEALMIVHANKEKELNEKHAEQQANFDKLMTEKKEAAENEIAELKARYSKLSSELREEYAEAKKSLEKQRLREAEEYAYNLKRERAKEDDIWADKKAAREKELALREEAVVLREADVAFLETEVEALNTELKEVQEKAKLDIAQALKDGEAKAEKVCAIKIAGIQKDAKWEKEILEREIKSLKASLESKSAECDTLSKKLDEAYGRIQNMAIEQSKASTPRILDNK